MFLQTFIEKMQDKGQCSGLLNPYLEGIVWIPGLFILTKTWTKN